MDVAPAAQAANSSDRHIGQTAKQPSSWGAYAAAFAARQDELAAQAMRPSPYSAGHEDALRSELSVMGLPELLERAAEQQIFGERLDEAVKSRDPAAEVTALLVGRETTRFKATHAAWLLEFGELVDARLEYQAAIASQVKLLGATHQETLATQFEFGSLLYAAAQDLASQTTATAYLREARRTFEAVLTGQDQLFGHTAVVTVNTQATLAALLKELGDVAGATKLYQDIIDNQVYSSDAEKVPTLMAQGNLAELQVLAGIDLAAKGSTSPAGVLPVVITTLTKVQSAESASVLYFRSALALLYQKQGDSERAKLEWEAILPLQEAVGSEGAQWAELTRARLAECNRGTWATYPPSSAGEESFAAS